MDTMFQFGRKVVFTKTELDARLGRHDEQYYDEERFVAFSGQRYALRGRSRTAELTWEYNEVFEVTRDQVTAYHITTDYQDLLQKDIEERQAQEQVGQGRAGDDRAGPSSAERGETDRTKE
ncbi:MAG: hypothetical protein K0R57_2171 [Paenibacillaceae bacterium]|jgi:hypothetical protein|nr:hypothetical protein [Paenibacillaceae bacterium]